MAGDFAVGSIAALCSIVVLWFGPIALLRSRNSRYPFAPEQMYGYAADKVKAALRS